MIYYHETIQSNITKGKAPGAKSRGNQVRVSAGPPPVGSPGPTETPQQQAVHVKCLPPEKLAHGLQFKYRTPPLAVWVVGALPRSKSLDPSQGQPRQEALQRWQSVNSLLHSPSVYKPFYKPLPQLFHSLRFHALIPSVTLSSWTQSMSPGLSNPVWSLYPLFLSVYVLLAVLPTRHTRHVQNDTPLPSEIGFLLSFTMLDGGPL